MTNTYYFLYIKKRKKKKKRKIHVKNMGQPDPTRNSIDSTQTACFAMSIIRYVVIY